MKKTLLVFALSAVIGCAHPEPTRYQIFGIKRFRQVKLDKPKTRRSKLTLNARRRQGHLQKTNTAGVRCGKCLFFGLRWG